MLFYFYGNKLIINYDRQFLKKTMITKDGSS